ncbi:MAG: hypothetical protein B6241_10150 [Spirochaetaceae bacterium 4572_59]|nr:MAG: hypothetical protein B6241_10150 [Spirochaetaceae bacterium 4572_59]
MPYNGWYYVLLYLIFSTLQKKPPLKDQEEDFLMGEEKTSECPLCGKDLHRGERVHSVVYTKGEDRLMNIYGCPWCYKDHPAGHKSALRDRKCPSCGTPLKEGSFAIARVFERPGKKIHVHVLGCPVCRNRR